MLKNIGVTELLVILAILVLLFGGKKIPELIRGIGETIREYKKGASGNSDDDQK